MVVSKISNQRKKFFLTKNINNSTNDSIDNYNCKLFYFDKLLQ